jgi:leucyl aminopeptidase
LDFKYSGENICKIVTDLLVVGMFKGDKFSGSVKSVNDALGDVLKTICGDEKFDGDLGKSVTVSSTFGKIGAKRVLLLGLGDKSRFSHDTVRKAGNLTAKKLKVASAHVTFGPEFNGGKGYIAALAEGVMLGSYGFDKYKTKNGAETEIENVLVISEEIKDRRFQEEISAAKAISESTCLARDMVNEPPVYMTPSRLADIASAVAGEGGMRCEIFDLEEIKRRVWRGSRRYRAADGAAQFIHHL